MTAASCGLSQRLPAAPALTGRGSHRRRPANSRAVVQRPHAQLADPSAGAALQEQIYAGVLQAKREQLRDRSRCEACWHLARECLCSALQPTQLTGPEQDVQVRIAPGGQIPFVVCACG